MGILTAWLVFPAALVVLSLGCGLLLDRVAGRVLPGALTVPAGFAVVLCVAGLITSSTALAGLALPALTVIALAGFALGLSRLRRSGLDRWAVGAALGIFLVFGAPAFLSGEPTFSGSLVLPDTSNQLVLAQRLSDGGPDYESLPPSSYQVSAQKYLSSQYPVAAQATLGVLAPAGFHEIAWLYQPFLAFMAAMTCLAIYALLASLLSRRWLRAAVAFVAAQPALAYSYALQGSIKETAAMTTFWLMAALVGHAIAGRAGARAFLPAAVTAAAMLGVLGPAALAYLAPLVLVLVATWIWRMVRAPRAAEAAWGVIALAVTAVLAIPILAGAKTAYTVNNAVLSMTEDLGNLAAPLEKIQAAGVWVGTDFRYPAEHPGPTHVLVAVVLLCALLGIAWSVRRRALGPLLAILSLAAVSAYLLRKGSPYADGKVLMVLSPAVVLAAGLGAASFAQARRRLRPVGVLLAVVLGAGVLGSNALAYHGVQNAPHHRYAELLKINGRYAGEGPALFTEYDEYTGYLLRDLRPYAAPEYPLVFRDGDPARKPNGLSDRDHRPSVKTPLDIEDLTGRFVQSTRLIVQRRSPTMSRPPANFSKVFSGRYYEVWRRERGPGAARVLAHLPLGPDLFSPGAVPRCRDVRRLARRARRSGGRLAYVERPGLVVSNPLRAARPKAWFLYAAYPRTIVPNGPGVLTESVRLPQGGPYRVWMEGSFGRRVEVRIDGRGVGQAAYEPGNPGQYVKVADVRLSPGRHAVRLTTKKESLRPGDGGGAQASLRQIGPLVFSPPSNEGRRLHTVPASGARELCGRRLDWIEVVSRGRRPGRS